MADIKQQGNSGNTVGATHVTIGYNALGQRTSLNRYESLGTTNLVATTNWGYDTANRLSLIEHKRNSTTFASYAYSYDGLSRITSINSLVDGVSNFSYDPTSQLTAADHSSQTDENYGYDLNGNRNTSGFTTGQNNQTLAGDGFTYTYDNEGNRTSRTETATGKVQEYVWDYRNRLVTVRDRNTAGGAIVKQVDYTYDAMNRLVKRTFDADGAGSGAAADQFWAYDEGINALFEFSGSSASSMTHRYIWSDQIDELIADSQITSLSNAGNTLWALSDHLGTIRDIADYTSGTDSTSITNHRKYNAYGKLVSETNSAVDLIFGFTGKQLDEATGLQHNLFRWYDSNLGQWLSEDPISFAAGDENVRRYVANAPHFRSDSFGLWGEPLGHHWVPLDYVRFLMTQKKLTESEYYYLYGRYSGSLEGGHSWYHVYNGVSYETYSAKVREQMEKWIEAQKPGGVTQFVDNIMNGKSYDGKDVVPEIAEFNRGVRAFSHFPEEADQAKLSYDAIVKKGHACAKARTKLIDHIEQWSHRYVRQADRLAGLQRIANGIEQSEKFIEIIRNGHAMEEAVRQAYLGNVEEVKILLADQGDHNDSLFSELSEAGINHFFLIGFWKSQQIYWGIQQSSWLSWFTGQQKEINWTENHELP